MPNRMMYAVLSLPHAKLLAMSESVNMFWNSSPIPSFEEYEWCLAAVFRHQRTSALSADVGDSKVCCLSAAAVVVLVILVCCWGVSAILVLVPELVFAVALLCVAPKKEIGSCSPRTRIRCWWMVDAPCDLIAITQFQVTFMVFLHTLQKASRSFPMTGLSQSINAGSSSQSCENLYFPIVRRKVAC